MFLFGKIFPAIDILLEKVLRQVGTFRKEKEEAAGSQV